MIIGEDLDGCWYDFRAGCLRWFRAKGLEIKDENLSLWHFHEQWDMSKEEYDALVDEGVDAGYIFKGPATRNAGYIAWKIRQLGHKLVIITHRWQGSPGNAERNTRQWLEDNYIVFDELIFSEDKTVVPTDMFLEDRIQNYDALVAAGTDAYLLNQPWNLTEADDDGTVIQARPRKRIDTIMQFLDAIEEKSG